MKVVHHDGPNGPPVTPPTPANGRFSIGVTPHQFGTDSTPVFNTCMRIDILRPGHDNAPYPIKALLTNLLQELQKVHHSNALLPIDASSTHGALMLPSDIPSDEIGIKRYFGGFQDAPGRNPKGNTTLAFLFDSDVSSLFVI
jgi:hypothetical protein